MITAHSRYVRSHML